LSVKMENLADLGNNPSTFFMKWIEENELRSHYDSTPGM